MLTQARKRAHKEIAHLTYARLKVQPADKPWPVDDIDAELRPLIDAFCNKVPRALLGGLWAADPRGPDSGAPRAARGVTSTSSSL